MRYATWGIVGIIVLLLGGLVGAAQRARGTQAGAANAAGPDAPKAGAPAAANAGQLELRNRNGEPVALCPLKHTAVSADVSGFVARVNLRQEFANPAREPVEAIYTFPMPEDAAVDDMTMTVGDRVIKGEIKRREEARRIYETAKAMGQAASLLDQERPNIFTQSVANIMPGEKIAIAISYVNLLKYDSGEYEFSFPMVVGPRYTPGGGYYAPGQRGQPSPPRPAPAPGEPRSQVTDAEKITPPITPPGTRAGHDISMTVNLDAGLPLQEVKSALHQVNVEKQGAQKATVRLSASKEIPNRDFILRFKVDGGQLQTGVLTHAPRAGDGYFTLILQPPSDPPKAQVAPKEMLFVIDQTGSQRGEPIKKAKETMRFCIENLNPNDTFQLIGFNTQIFPCFPGPVPVTPENLKKAWDFLAPIEGNGGTDILKSIDFALKIPTDPERPRIVCYLTDGYVGNDMQILDHIRRHRGDVRIFPFGVGNSVNRFLIDGMAREGRGAPYYVTLNTPGEQAAAKFYQRVAKPLLLDVKVEWGGLPVTDIYPKAIPDVFSAMPIILKGRYTRAAEGEVTISGLSGGKPWSRSMRVSLPGERKEGAALPSLWAREKIEDLQAQDWHGAQMGKPDPTVQEKIVNLALDYRLMSQHTSFVAVEQKVVNIGGRQRTIDVPVEMPDGVSYEGIFGAEAERLALFSRGAVGPAAPGAGGAAGGFGAGGVRQLSRSEQRARPAASPLARLPAQQPGLAAGRRLTEARGDQDGASLYFLQANRDVAFGTAEGGKRLEAMKPEERVQVLTQVKLAEALHGLAERLKKEGASGSLKKDGVEVEKGRVLLQVWLNDLPADAQAKLKALGFELAATLMPKRLLLGSLPVEKIDALLELPFVRLAEPPKFKQAKA